VNGGAMYLSEDKSSGTLRRMLRQLEKSNRQKDT
jgi:hypothetical protein